MKALITTAALVALVAATTATSVAQERSTPTQEARVQTGNVASVLAARSDLSVFSTLLDASGLRPQLAKGGPYTILAPTDEAFGVLGEGVLENLMAPENRGKLVSLIRYHVIPARMEASSIRTGEVKTLQGSKVAFNADSSAIWIGRAEIMRPDIRAGNGVIHTINMVMEPDEQ